MSKRGSGMELESVGWNRRRVKVRMSPDFGLRVVVVVATTPAASAARNKEVVLLPQYERPMFARRMLFR